MIPRSPGSEVELAAVIAALGRLGRQVRAELVPFARHMQNVVSKSLAASSRDNDAPETRDREPYT